MANVKGQGGHDCMVIPRRWFPCLQLQDMVFGVGGWGFAVISELMRLSQFDSAHGSRYRILKPGQDFPKQGITRSVVVAVAVVAVVVVVMVEYARAWGAESLASHVASFSHLILPQHCKHTPMRQTPTCTPMAHVWRARHCTKHLGRAPPQRRGTSQPSHVHARRLEPARRHIGSQVANPKRWYSNPVPWLGPGRKNQLGYNMRLKAEVDLKLKIIDRPPSICTRGYMRGGDKGQEGLAKQCSARSANGGLTRCRKKRGAQQPLGFAVLPPTHVDGLKALVGQLTGLEAGSVHDEALPEDQFGQMATLFVHTMDL